ncbi:MAG TPA: ornithine cyclodeaminase family protein [Caulobacteraceae bacterium]|jgi:ornithine cyclodeaminase|nr:ornithine cyclodeaminase family protein [Caulobacteraceae bacterium]
MSSSHAPAKIRILNPQAVAQCLPLPACIELMRSAFRQVSEGRTAQPIRAMVKTRDQSGFMGWMPGYVDDPKRLGIKTVTIFPNVRDIKSHQGLVQLFDGETGALLGAMDASEITGIRTAAATAAATDALARKDAKTLSIFGLGEQASTHLKALALVRKFERCLVWGRDAAKTRAFIQEHQGGCAFPLEAVSSPEAAAGSDVLCTVSAAPDPFFKGAWLKPGQHINVVGSSIPSTAEVDHDTVARSRVFVDFRDSALALAGELRRAFEAGVVTPDHIAGEVGEVLIGKVPGRRSPEDITMFKSLGMVSEDVLSADFILREAERTGAGVVIDW